MKNELPLKEISIDELFNGQNVTYEIPIYQRNYAWEKDEISALVQDVYHAWQKHSKTYFIGTLVSFNKGELVYEIIDGQQRLTTIYIILKVLDCAPKNRLSYRARKKSDRTLQALPATNIDEKDNGIITGYKYAKNAIDEIINPTDKTSFQSYFLKNVHIIHYQVPRDIDLNHYFEIMNSRGEQLEMSEIIKARLMEKLNDSDKLAFNRIWECVSDMNVYIQQKFASVSSDLSRKIFGKSLEVFPIDSFDDLKEVIGNGNNLNTISINEMLNMNLSDDSKSIEVQKDKFISIIDFSNFLLIVLKLTRLDEIGFKPSEFTLDDKELIKEFDKLERIGRLDEQFIKRFIYNLLKAKFFLDNYIVHRTGDEVSLDNNPWNVECWHKEDDKKEYVKNLANDAIEIELVQLLSMLEVTFTPHNRKNYLLYCLLHLFKNSDVNDYCEFLKQMLEKFFKDIYLNSQRLYDNNNTPIPGSFDEVMLDENNHLTTTIENRKADNELCKDFISIYGDGEKTKSNGIPLFVFNYLDYRIWERYVEELRGKDLKAESQERRAFYESMGCSDFGLELFQKFYFSRTRKSLEHFFPQHQASSEEGRPDEKQINCLGNYAMIGSDANSSGSDWFPISKLHHYRDDSSKISIVSVASLKMMIMMQICKDNEAQREQNKEWLFEDIQAHQKNMLKLLFPQLISSSQPTVGNMPLQ